MTYQTHKYYYVLQNYYLEQTCLHWPTFTLNMNPVFSVGIFEMIIVLKW